MIINSIQVECFVHLHHLQLLGEVVGDDDSERGEERGKEHTHVANINRDIQQMHHVVEKRRRHH